MLSGRFKHPVLIFGILLPGLLACGKKGPVESTQQTSADTTAVRQTTAAQPPARPRLLPATRISPYDRIIKKYSRRYGFDWRLIAAQIFVESRFNPEARSHRGALGLMQILPGTARHFGINPKLLLKPEQNIALGTFYDRRLYNLWDGTQGIHRIAFMLASYNAGRRRVLRAQQRTRKPHLWEGVRPHLPKQTREYVTKIFRKYNYYKTRYF